MGERWVFKLSPAGDYGKLVPLINSAEPGDMPAFTPTMKLAIEGLLKSDAAAKQLIIITDGDPAPPPPSLVDEFIKAKIKISMISIFPHGGGEVALMAEIAKATGGNYYSPQDPNELPRIFIKEAKTLRRSMIQNISFTPRQGIASPVLNGITEIPQLHGYVISTLKESPQVENLLYAHVRDSNTDSEDDDPVLATWRYGLGRTAAFTSDLSNNFARDWVEWDKYQSFVQQLIVSISRIPHDGHLRLWAETGAGDGLITVEDFHPHEMFLDVAAQVSGPQSRSMTLPLKQIGPRRYQARFAQWGPGHYQINVVGKAGERTDRCLGGFIVSYSPEYLQFTSNYATLREIHERTHGTELTLDSKQEDIFNRRDPKQSSRPIFDWLLIALAFLVPLDVGLRRVQLDWDLIKSWFRGRKHSGSTETMSTLLSRKKEVSQQLQSRKQTTTIVSPPRPAGATIPPTGTISPTATSPPPPTVAPPKDASTTGRLLDLKRKRDQEGK